MESIKQAGKLPILLAWAAFLGLYAWFYHEALWTYFSQDDFPLLATSRPGWASFWRFFEMGGPQAYRPLTQHVYFYLNQLLYDLDPVGHHFSNFLVHLANSLLAGWLSSRWIAKWTFLPAAFLYAFHPVHFNPVFWISGITQSGYLFFLLCSLACFTAYRRSGHIWILAAACLAGICAFFSKEDSVALPAILTVSAFLPLADGDRLSLRQRLSALLPFWLSLALFWIWRLYFVGFGLPRTGVYDVTLDLALVLRKLYQYARWLFVDEAFLAAFAVLLIGASVAALRSESRRELAVSGLRLAALAVMAFFSLAPSFVIPATVDYYTSFAAAALAWATMLLLTKFPFLKMRAAAAVLMLSVLFAVSLDRQQANLSAQDLYRPIPVKARLCRKWVGQLRRLEAPPHDCTLFFRDLPFSSWEKDWFVSLPMLAWNRPFFHISAATQEDNAEVPKPVNSCLMVWSFSSGDAVLIRSQR